MFKKIYGMNGYVDAILICHFLYVILQFSVNARCCFI